MKKFKTTQETIETEMKQTIKLKEKELKLRQAQEKIRQMTDEEIYNLLNDEAKEKCKKYENSNLKPLPTLADYIK